MFVSRQIQSKLGVGQQTQVGLCTRFPFRMIDSNPRYKLVVPDGMVVSSYGPAAGGATVVLPLPQAYTATAGGLPLYFALKANGVANVQYVSPDHGTGAYVLQGTSGTTLGAHDGMIVGCMTLTSIQLVLPASPAAGILYEWFAFQLPDLTQSASYRDGYRAQGYSTT